MRLLWLTLLFVLRCSGEPAHALVLGWPDLPKDHRLGLCAGVGVGVGVDAQNHIFVFHRGERRWSKSLPKEPIATVMVSVIGGKTGKLLNAARSFD